MIPLILLLLTGLVVVDTDSDPVALEPGVIIVRDAGPLVVPGPYDLGALPPGEVEAPAKTETASPSAPETLIAEQPSSAKPLRRAAAEIEPITKTPDIAPAATPEPMTAGLLLVRGEQNYASQGKKVRMEVLRPDSDDRRPAILILHGSSGIGDGAFYRGAAEIFAERGYVTFLPHYLAASPPKSGFTGQERVLLDALETIAANPYVDPSRIGVFGLSLGGFHALNLSSRDYRVAAVVDMAGALRGNVMPASGRIAPTLALHGARDKTVPVSRARSLATYLKQNGVPHELVIYPDQGHFFLGKAQQDAMQRSVSFFGNYLIKPTTDPGSRTASPAPAK